MHKIHFRFHGLKSFHTINIRNCFNILGKFIKYGQLIIFIFHKKSISYLYVTCPIKSTKFLCCLSFMLNIQHYIFRLEFYLDVSFCFLNFFMFYFPPNTPFNKKFHSLRKQHVLRKIHIV